LRILFDNDVPVRVRRFLPKHEVLTVIEMNWPPQLENGELLRLSERAGFDLLLTSDQNLRHQQNLVGRKLAVVTLGSNIWRIVATHEAEIAAAVGEAAPGSYRLIEMPLPPKPRTPSK
jgi:predicted nuclease of predicted toxin-antitoxin system